MLQLEKKVKGNLCTLGFDYGLVGTRYISNIIMSIYKCPQLLHEICTQNLSVMAEEINKNNKAIDKNIRFAINNAYINGALSQVTIFKNNKPSLKQLINWLYDFFICDDLFLY